MELVIQPCLTNFFVSFWFLSLPLSRVGVSALAFVVVGIAELYTAIGIEHRVDFDAVAVVVVVVVAKGEVAVDIVIAVLVA